MSYAMVFFTFLNSWWVCLLISLPLARIEGEKSEIAYSAAPAGFNWKKAVLTTTVLAALVTGALMLVVDSGYFHMDTLS